MPGAVLSLLLAVVLLDVGSGLQDVLIPIRAQLAGFPTGLIGGFGTAYYLGFVAGCLAMRRVVRQVGHIRAFAAVAAVAASTVLLHGIAVVPPLWLALRLLTGACFAGLLMVVESWLNVQATIESRGRVLAAYMVATWVGLLAGKLAFPVASPQGFVLFALACMGVALSLVPIALTPATAPALPTAVALDLREVYRVSPTGVVGCLAVGLTNGAFWTLAPLYAEARTGSGLGIGLFMSACVVGGALSQWPIGRWSDRMDRRVMIVATCAAAAAAGLAMIAARGPWLWATGMAFGAASLPIYALCSAQANDRGPPEASVELASRLLLLFGLGAAAGPLLASQLMQAVAPFGLFVFTAAVHGLLALFVLARLRHEPPVRARERAAFAPVPPVAHASPLVFEMHPAGEPPPGAEEVP